MSHKRLPLVGSSGSKSTAKPPFPSPALQSPHRPNRRKTNQQKQTFSSANPHQGLILADTTMTPWGSLALSDSSFPTIPPMVLPKVPKLPPPPPPAPQPSPSSPCQGNLEIEEKNSNSSFSSDIPSPFPLPVVVCNHAGGVRKGSRSRKRISPQEQISRPPRLPPLSPITNLSFSRSFTFSFFELPLHQSPRFRAERIKNIYLLIKQIHY